VPFEEQAVEFNLNHDVDVYSRVIDHTRASSRLGLSCGYKSYSLCAIREWLSGLVAEFKVHKFPIPVDLTYFERGLGKATVKLDMGERLQLSAGMLLNWGILEVKK
jgi:hypothetical protein